MHAPLGGTRRNFLIANAVWLATWELVSPPGTSSADEVDTAKLDGIRAKMQEFVDQRQLAGAVTLVGRREAILSFEAVGQRDRERQLPMEKDTLFRIASMTKPITALGIMLLIDEGKLSMDDPVEKHLPEFRGQMLVASRDGEQMALKKPARPITVRDLLTHTSGMPGSPPVGVADLYLTRDRTLAEGVCLFSQRPLDFEPGSKWAYCNAGIDTLGRIIEVLSGLSYEDFLQQRLFQPLGMKDTTCFPRPEQRDRIAVIYDQQEGRLVPRENVVIGPATNAKYPVPAGGLYSTAADLARFYQMMLRRGATEAGKRLVSEESIAAMTRLQTGELTAGFTPGMGFGLGWAVVRTPMEVTSMLSPGTYGHGGAFGTQGWIDPHQDRFVILLIQRVGLPNGDASDFRRALQELAWGAVK